MRGLILSLIAVVVVAVISLGWLISEVYYRVASNGLQANTEFAGYQHMGSVLARALDASSDSAALLDQWRADSDLKLSLQARDSFPIPDQLAKTFENGEPLVLQSEGEVSLHFFLQNSGQVMSLVLPASEQRAVADLLLTLLFYAGVVAIVLIWLYPLIRRLIRLRNTARALGQGDLDARVAISRTSYIAEIEREFNRMAERIQTLISDNKLLSQAVSHDLKTPLARLRFGIDTLAETTDKAAGDKYIGRLNKDLLEMESLVETLLQYARLDESNVQLQMEQLDLKSFVAALFADLAASAVKLDYRLTEARTIISADTKYLSILLNNVMSNALKHAAGQVRLNITTTEGTVSICIEDDGAGIPAAERDHVTKPFWRGASSAGTSGHGMGLAIVARIAAWMGTRLEVNESRELGGAAILLHFDSRR